VSGQPAAGVTVRSGRPGGLVVVSSAHGSQVRSPFYVVCVSVCCSVGIGATVGAPCECVWDEIAQFHTIFPVTDTWIYKDVSGLRRGSSGTFAETWVRMDAASKIAILTFSPS